MNLTDRLITAIVEKCDGLSITAEQASNILAYLQYGAPMNNASPQADAAPSEDAYVAKRLSEALADVYMTIIGTDTPDADDGSNAIERVKKAAQVLRLEVDLHRSQADAAIAAGGAQEPVVTVGWTGHGEADNAIILLGRLDVSADDDARVDQIERAIRYLAKQAIAAPLPREAATVALTDEQRDELQEAREILENMVRSIELDGNYSTEATCTFLRQALQCLPIADPAASSGEQS